MPINKLTAVAVRNLKRAGRHSDGGNLYLAVSKSGARSWVFFYRRDGRVRELGLGSLQSVPLQEAREKARTMRDALASGQALKAAIVSGKTFGECADELIASMSPSWRNPKHRAQWVMTLGRYAASLRPLPVDAVTTSDVLGVLSPLWSARPETASRLRGRIEAVLDSAKARGLRSGDNPATWRGHLSKILPKRQKLSRRHLAAMAVDDLPSFMRRLREQSGASARALEFTILTAARSGEVLGARWSEISNNTWIIPAERMKGKRPHRVPLSSSALDVLRQQQEFGFADLRALPGSSDSD